jgi:hypothetical protein
VVRQEPRFVEELDVCSVGQAQQESANVLGYASYAWALMSLNGLADSRSTIQRALDEKLDSDELHTELYTLAFLAGDAQGMSEQVAWSNRSSDAMREMLPPQAAAGAYSGQVQKSLDLSRLTADALQRAGRKRELRPRSWLRLCAKRRLEICRKRGG